MPQPPVEAEDPLRSVGQSSKQGRQVVRCQQVQRAAQAFAVQPPRRHSRPRQPVYGLLARNCGTGYSRRLLCPGPLSTMAVVAVPTLTYCSELMANLSRYSSSPIPRQTPARIPK